MTQLIVVAFREYSDRGIDYSEDYEPLEELIDRFPNILIPIPFFLIFLLIAFLVLSKRKSIKDYDRRWFYTNDDDNGWYKFLIIFGWIAGILCVLPAVFTGIEILLRIVVGGTLTVVSWLFYWAISLLVLLLIVVFIPFIGYAILEDKNKILAIIVGGTLFCGTLYLVVNFWNTIMSWSFMFPPLKFNL